MNNEFDPLEKLFKKAVNCRICFEQEWVSPALVNIAQPRLVGSQYHDNDPRILVMLINPGVGGDRSGANRKLLALLQEYRDTEATIDKIFEHQRHTIGKWSSGTFAEFYLEGLTLDLECVAFANISWCATIKTTKDEKKYPPQMLNKCFKLHTLSLVELLDPTIIILSGTNTHKFEAEIISILPAVRIIPMYHYAYFNLPFLGSKKIREKKKREELERVRRLIWSESEE